MLTACWAAVFSNCHSSKSIVQTVQLYRHTPAAQTGTPAGKKCTVWKKQRMVQFPIDSLLQPGCSAVRLYSLGSTSLMHSASDRTSQQHIPCATFLLFAPTLSTIASTMCYSCIAHTWLEVAPLVLHGVGATEQRRSNTRASGQLR